MDITFKLNNLSKKNDVQLNKEMDRRGLRYSGKAKNDKICEIIAYDAYNAGRSDYKQKVKKTEKKSTNSIRSIKINDVTSEIALKERFNIVLTDKANDTVAFLKVTEDHMDMLDYLIDHDWLTDVSYTKTEQVGWDEP